MSDFASVEISAEVLSAATTPQTQTTPAWTAESIMAAPGAEAVFGGKAPTKKQAAEMAVLLALDPAHPQALSSGKKSGLTKRLKGTASEIAARAAQHPNRAGKAPAKKG